MQPPLEHPEPADSVTPGALGRRALASSRAGATAAPLRYGLVFVGGALGTGLRYLLELALPAPSGWPLPTLLINLVGAFVLGALLESLLQRGSDSGWRQRVRLFGGPGFLGGFTTYSTLALESARLFGSSRLGVALLYDGLSLVVGVLAALAGIAAARALVPVAGGSADASTPAAVVAEPNVAGRAAQGASAADPAPTRGRGSGDAADDGDGSDGRDREPDRTTRSDEGGEP